MLNKEQLDLLASFANGPKIWDATPLFAIVCEMHDAGYVKFIGDGPKAEITDAGRALLESLKVDHAPLCTGAHAPGEACTR